VGSDDPHSESTFPPVAQDHQFAKITILRDEDAVIAIGLI
jgi:hypothetical protein